MTSSYLRGQIIREYGQTLLVEANQRIYECFSRKNIATTTVGDYVLIDTSLNNPVIVERLPRSTVLARSDRYHPVKEIAANLTQVMIVLALAPPTSEIYLDQYLCAAELAHLPVFIVLNKIDLLDASNAAIRTALDYYKAIGYNIIPISVAQQQNIAGLTASLQNQATLMLGVSGVGKSSLLNLLIGGDAAVGNISMANQKGQHTTSTCSLYHLPFGGDIFDAPGIREFNLTSAQKPDLIYGFREFKPYLGHCKFRNCSHQGDPGCVLEQAVLLGKISEARFKNYFRMLRA